MIGWISVIEMKYFCHFTFIIYFKKTKKQRRVKGLVGVIITCQEFEVNPNYGNHPKGGGKQGDGLFFTNLNYVKIRDNYMQIYNKQNKHNCI